MSSLSKFAGHVEGHPEFAGEINPLDHYPERSYLQFWAASLPIPGSKRFGSPQAFNLIGDSLIQ